MLIAFLENNLQEDGTVKIPKVLQPYMGGMELWYRSINRKKYVGNRPAEVPWHLQTVRRWQKAARFIMRWLSLYSRFEILRARFYVIISKTQ